MFRRCLGRLCAGVPKRPTGPASTAASSSSPPSSAVTATDHGTSDGEDVAPTPWMKGAAWASLGSEFKSITDDKFLKTRPEGFLSPRATTDVQPAEELLSTLVAQNGERYKGVDVRDPSSLAHYDGERPNALLMTMGDKVRAVSEFISGHLAHQISLQEWLGLFDLENMEMDLMYWLYVLHIHIIARRATSVPIDQWSRRREVLEELSLTMFDSWTHTAEVVMGRPPLSKIRNYIKDMYYVVSVNLEEALQHDGPGADLMLMGVLLKFCPLPRPEDVPMYTYYQLVHYVRFHTALFDRIPDDQFSIGNFNFLNPKDPAIFQPYTTIELDDIIRGWTADGGDEVGTSPGGRESAAAAGDAAGEQAGSEGSSR